MTAWEAAAAHPTLAALVAVAVVYLAPRMVTEPLRLLVAWRRPGDCPRCGGTGRERLKPEGTAKP